jgi:hypothetical protein
VKKGKASLRTLRRGARAEEIKILSGVPGISPAMATQILTTGGVGNTPVALSTFLTYNEGAMAETSIRQKGRTVRLGDARAERISRLMHHRVAGAAAAAKLCPLDDDELDDLLDL